MRRRTPLVLSLTIVASARVLVPAPAAVAAPPAPAHSSACPAPADIERRIAFYSDQIREQPRLYPSLALLGRAYLERARWSGQASDLATARQHLLASIAIQPSLDAFKGLAAAADYGHRFAETLTWSDRARSASPEDPEILFLRAEALIALDRLEELEALLARAARGPAPGGAHILAARGMLAAARSDPVAAAAALEPAATLAARASAPELAVWALVTAAAAYLDAGQPDAAAPYLQAAERIDANDFGLQVHSAELDEWRGRHTEALAGYERLLERRCDPELDRRAYVLARRLGRKEEAARHYTAALRQWRDGLDRGEVYPLEGLASLYCDAESDLDQAVALAARNLEGKHDRGARAVYARAVALRELGGKHR